MFKVYSLDQVGVDVTSLVADWRSKLANSTSVKNEKTACEYLWRCLIYWWDVSSFEAHLLSTHFGWCYSFLRFHTGIRPSVQAPGTHTPALCEEVAGSLRKAFKRQSQQSMRIAISWFCDLVASEVKKLVAPNPGWAPKTELALDQLKQVQCNILCRFVPNLSVRLW